ncbi:hypothetical protein [Yoonia sp. MH D7]
MIRTVLIVSALSLAGCGTMTDFRSNLMGGGNSSSATTQVMAPAPMTPIAPVAPVMTAKERLVASIEGQGCELNSTNVGAVLNSATITREELLQLTPQLQSEGRVVVSGSGAIRVTSANCI